MSRRVLHAIALSAIAMFALVQPALLAAQTSRAPAAQPATTAAQLGNGPVAPDSPRASIENFQRLARAGNWASAAQYLTLAPEDSTRGALLARRLALVLDQRLELDPRLLSPLALGDTADGDYEFDRLGVIIGPNGLPEPVRIHRVDDGRLARWMFGPATVALVDFWYANLGAPWVRDRVPPSLMQEGPLHVLWWQWIGLGVSIVLLFLLSLFFGWILRTVLARLVLRTKTDWDDQLLERLRGPLRLWIGAVAASPIPAVLDLNARVSGVLDSTARGLVLLSIFWALLRSIRLGQDRLESAAWNSGQTQARTLVPMLGNLLRVTLGIFALLVALSQFGYQVTSLLAGLGIGGIAVALAGQKTVEHLFGSVSLAADKAFRVGDFVRVGTLEGTVERIGLRSTSFRTNERTIVRVPNGRLAEERIETFGARDRVLLKTSIGITYDTTPEVLSDIRSAIEKCLRDEPKIWPDQILVHVIGLGESAVQLRIIAWFQTTNYQEFLDIRHRLLLEFMRIIERHGSTIAFPTRTVHHIWDGPGSPPGGPGPVIGEG